MFFEFCFYSQAPSDVLEALNRLLDDNRELFVPELQCSIKPHPHFMLFATQNPPGIYGGRKVIPSLKYKLHSVWCCHASFPKNEQG